MGNVANLYQDGVLVDAPPLIPAGEYEAVYLRHSTAFIFNSAKVFVHFRISGGEHNGATLFRAYRVKSITGRPRKGGAFKVRHSHDLYRQFVRVVGCRERPDRINLARLRGCLLKVSVVTVTKNSRQKALLPALQYSRVDEMLSCEVGQP